MKSRNGYKSIISIVMMQLKACGFFWNFVLQNVIFSCDNIGMKW